MTIEKSYRILKWVFLGLLIFMFFSIPIVHETNFLDMYSDATIQTKIGLDSIEQGQIMLNEQYSWHDGLNWIPHETGWYWILGFLYKNFGLLGIVSLSIILNTLLGCLITYKIKDNSLWSILLAFLILYMGSVPLYNARPHTLSIPLTILSFILLRDRKFSVKVGIFEVVAMWAISWVHGGILPIFATILLVFAAIDFIYGDKKEGIAKSVTLVIGVLVSLLNPIGIDIWLYFTKVLGDEVNTFVSEWQPSTFTFIMALFLSIFSVCLCFNKKITLSNKTAMQNIAIYFMFFIATCIHCRFGVYLTIIMALSFPSLLDNLVLEIKQSNLSIRKIIDNRVFTKLSSLTEVKVGLMSLSSIVFVFLIILQVKNNVEIFKTNTMSDIFVKNDIDENVVEVIKERGYERVYNNYNDGSWLIFNNIPVNIDNRCDPYLKEISGKDYIVMNHNIKSLEDSIKENNADVILCNTLVDEVPENFIFYMLQSDNYRVVYENVVGAKIWYLIEPV